MSERSSWRSSRPDRSERVEISLTEMITSYRDAIVTITGITQSGTTITCNGFFIRYYFILCPYEVCAYKQQLLVEINSHIYPGQVYGYDARANIAILQVPSYLEELQLTGRVAPFLHWGRSINTSLGEIVVVIGNIQRQEQKNSVVIGYLSDNRHSSTCCSLGELLLLSGFDSNPLLSGAPVMTAQGLVIGMMMHYQKSHTLALSEYFLRRPLKALLTTELQSYDYSLTIDQGIRVYHSAYVGIYGFLMTTADIYMAWSISENGQLLKKYDPELKWTQIMGYRVTFSTDSNLEVGDIITHINNTPIGNRRGQTSAALVMWRIVPGSAVEILYYKQKDKFALQKPLELYTKKYSGEVGKKLGHCIL